MLAGLVVLLGLLAPGGQAASRGQTRTYCIGAEEVRWDYAPLGRNNITGQPFGPAENIFVKQGPDRIGRVYVKALYREYTDATFTHLKPRPKWEHLGCWAGVAGRGGRHHRGPLQEPDPLCHERAPRGVFYRKDSEGVGHNLGISGAAKADDAIWPGGRHRYVWQIPARSGPGPNDLSSVLWMYHSHVDESGDTKRRAGRADHRHRQVQDKAGWLTRGCGTPVRHPIHGVR